jgi:hypothetical protein
MTICVDVLETIDAAAPPTVTPVTPENPVPAMVTVVPPVTVPDEGLTDETVGGGST